MDKYIKEHSTAQGEALDWVEKQTNIRTNHARMLSGAVLGRFLNFVVQMTGASRILELGAFTGYSAICLASALGPDGHLDTLEINDELEDLILEGFERAGVADRITLHIGDCKETLAKLKGLDSMTAHIAHEDCEADAKELADKKSPDIKVTGTNLYDLVYIDANKREYCEYYDLVFDMVRPGGWILADNVLWDGKVCLDPLPQDKQTIGIARFNDMIINDPRVESVILPLRDGLNLIHKLP